MDEIDVRSHLFLWKWTRVEKINVLLHLLHTGVFLPRCLKLTTRIWVCQLSTELVRFENCHPNRLIELGELGMSGSLLHSSGLTMKKPNRE